MKKQRGFIETTMIVMLLVFVGIVGSHEASKKKQAEVEQQKTAQQ